MLDRALRSPGLSIAFAVGLLLTAFQFSIRSSRSSSARSTSWRR